MAASDVLIVGAGPTGLVLGLWLTSLGLSVRILDKAPGPGTTSRALLVQARTLELYRQLDLAEAVLTKGRRVEALNVWVEGEPKARVEVGALGQGLTPYPYLQILPQDEHETLLVQRLAELGVTIERRSELLNYADHGSHVSARFLNSQGNEEICRAMNGEVRVDLDEADFLMVIAMGRQERARLIGVVGDERADNANALTFADVSQTVIDKMRTVNWFSTYRVPDQIDGVAHSSGGSDAISDYFAMRRIAPT